MGQGIQEWTKKNLLKTAFKKFEVIWSACFFQHLEVSSMVNSYSLIDLVV